MKLTYLYRCHEHGNDFEILYSMFIRFIIFTFFYSDDPVLKVIEYIVMKDMLHTKSHHVKISQCLKSLANWTVQDTDSTKLTRFLLEGLEMSIRAQLPQGKI